LFNRGPSGWFIAIGENDKGAISRKGFGAAETNPFCAARDDADFSLKLHNHLREGLWTSHGSVASPV
jgi:hypothetical protein